MEIMPRYDFDLDVLPVSFDIYQALALETAQYPNVGENIEYPTLGLCGEAGELANKVKKIQRDCDGIFAVNMKIALIKELGDVLWYCAAIAHEIGIDLATVAAANIASLSDRKERDVIKGDGDDR